MLDIQKSAVPTLKKYGVKRASLFGSYSRGEENSSSDIDLLIEPPANMGLFAFVRLKSELEDVLKKEVDLVTFNGLSRYLKEDIMNSQKPIL